MIIADVGRDAVIGITAAAVSSGSLALAFWNSRKGAKKTWVEQLEARIQLCEDDRTRLTEHVDRLSIEVERLGAREVELMRLLVKATPI